MSSDLPQYSKEDAGEIN
jgi:hypothetical protein